MKSFKVKEKNPTHFANLAVGNLTTQNLYISSQPSIPKQPSIEEKKGILYSNQGVLIYKGPDGTITFIANS